MISVACFGVRISVMFHLIKYKVEFLMFVHYTLVRFGLLSGHLLGNSCPLGWSFVLIVFSPFLICIYFPFTFQEQDLAFDCASSCSLVTFL